MQGSAFARKIEAEKEKARNLEKIQKMHDKDETRRISNGQAKGIINNIGSTSGNA